MRLAAMIVMAAMMIVTMERYQFGSGTWIEMGFQ